MYDAIGNVNMILQHPLSASLAALRDTARERETQRHAAWKVERKHWQTMRLQANEDCGRNTVYMPL